MSHLWRHGLRSGWSAYRYGERKAISLPVVTPAPKIVKGKARKELVSRCKRIMEDWQESRFEHEGTARASLRAGLCLEGNAWATSDQEAAGIVADVLRAIGAVRPSWAEGQPEYAEMGYRCLVCRSRLPRTLLSGLFCSAACGTKYRARAGFQARHRADDHYMRVSHALELVRNPPRKCAHCSKTFRSRDPNQTYCSIRCAKRHHLGEALLQEQACAQCGTKFQPANRGQVYCSHACHATARNAAIREQMAGTIRSCECCGSAFTPTAEWSVYCSAKCGRVMASRAYTARKRIAEAAQAGTILSLSPPIFDTVFAKAA